MTGSTRSPARDTTRACSTRSSPPCDTWRARRSARGGVTRPSESGGSRRGSRPSRLVVRIAAMRAEERLITFGGVPSFPSYRPRRLRRTESLRRLVRETSLSASQLVLPLFVRPGSGVRQPVDAMPGVFQTSIDEMLVDAREAARLGVGGVLLFGIPETKDATGSQAYNDDAPVQQAVRSLKRELPDLVVITDVCLCEYTD